jgi:hypothetical protein
MCEDYPCCGHTAGDPCPRVTKTGRVVATCVECGKRLAARASSSICAKCQRQMAREGDWDGRDGYW